LKHLAALVARADHYLVKVPQRMQTQVLLGLAAILVSHFAHDADERAWLRDAGSAVIAFAVTRWLAHQGKRRHDPMGRLLRNPTMEFKLPPDFPRPR